MQSVILRVKKANTIKEKAFGLIFKQKAEPMLFRTRFGIHTFGMGYPIDVIVLDTNHSVVVMKENLASNRIFLWKPSFDTIIELPAGYCKTHAIKKGTKVKLIIE